jgi:hypothetical protein
MKQTKNNLDEAEKYLDAVWVETYCILRNNGVSERNAILQANESIEIDRAAILTELVKK